jgi:hypothetical protein
MLVHDMMVHDTMENDMTVHGTMVHDMTVHDNWQLSRFFFQLFLS